MTLQSNPKTWAMITAGGRSQRFNAGLFSQESQTKHEHKLLQPLQGQSILSWSVRGVLESSCIQGAVLTLPQGEESLFAEELQRLRLSFSQIPIHQCTGGESRRASVKAGLHYLQKNFEIAPMDLVVIHDGARPLLKASWLSEVVETLRQHPDWHGIIAGHPVTDTLKATKASRIQHTVPRAGLYAVQTPQVFRFAPLWQAHNEVEESIDATDDAQLLELYLGEACRLQIQASPLSNLKITTPDDLALAHYYKQV
jgi:2-C-methyl-D-erythritol 4-phosphate cytidylyltransferase/2-C-methyl-D-erythritol 2,4-cyclodiphosphate synthase